MTIDLRLIRHVLMLAKHRNFARAADALHISQPALSRSIARLEEDLGVRLFDRTREGVVPTEYGDVVIERGGDIMNREHELQREIQMMRDLDAGELGIAAGPFPHAISCGPALGRLLAAHPKLHVRLEKQSPHETVAKVLEGAVDLGIADIREWQEDARLQIEALPAHIGVWVSRAAHPLARRADLTLQEVLAYPLACTILPHTLAKHFGNAPMAGRLDPDSERFIPAVALDALMLAPSIVATSDTIFLTPPSLVADGLERGELMILDLHMPWQRTCYGFIFKHGRTLSKATQEYMACVRTVESELMEYESHLLATYGRFADRRQLAEALR